MRALARRDRRDERGAIAIVTAVAATLLLVVCALAVDVGNTWAVRGLLQTQVDNAAVYAADALPLDAGATRDASKLVVAKRVAFQVACNPVRGQKKLASIPACPSSPTASSLDTLAQSLLTTGKVTFPTDTTVRVIAPSSRVDWPLGVVGNDGTTQTKEATAKIYSPGTAAPIALSLECLTTAAGAVPLGVGDLASAVVPLNYIAAGPLTANSITEPPTATTLAAMPTGSATSLLSSISPTTQVQGASPLLPGVGFTTGGLLGLGRVRVHFYRGAEHYVSDVAAYLGAFGTASAGITVPTEVRNTAGKWFVQAEFKNTLIGAFTGTTFTAKASYKVYEVTPPVGLNELLACANLVDSPRRTNNSYAAPGNLRVNIKAGLDHNLTAHPSLVALNPPANVNASTVNDLLNGSLLSCPAPSSVNVFDNDATQVTPVPNCVHVATDGARQAEFTEGFLASPDGSFLGRLHCSVDPTHCSHGSFEIGGLPGAYNDDTLSNFVLRPSLLNSSLFFGLSTYLTDDLPIITPPSGALSADIYSSPRFMWVAVASRTATLGVGKCTTCPVLTFRPVFITQSQPSGLAVVDLLEQQVAGLLGGLSNLLVGLLFPWLLPAATGSDHGVVMNGTSLRALRFQTIEPTALPVTAQDYNGPVSDYLGLGPKVIRLIR